MHCERGLRGGGDREKRVSRIRIARKRLRRIEENLKRQEKKGESGEMRTLTGSYHKPYRVQREEEEDEKGQFIFESGKNKRGK